jgi:hypothetical protein
MAVALIQRPIFEQGPPILERRARSAPFCIVRCEQETWTGTDSEADRIRSVFGLSSYEPLPRVNVRNLRTYRRYLVDHLSFPFQALYAETKPPIRQLLCHISVLGLVEVIRSPSEGIVCTVDGVSSAWELPLAEIGCLEDNPSYSLIDGYASWFLNNR